MVLNSHSVLKSLCIGKDSLTGKKGEIMNDNQKA